MSGGLTAQSGSPWNVTVGFDQSGNVVTGSERPNLMLPADSIITGSVTQWANPAGFSLPAPGTLGNLAKRLSTGPGIVDLDYSVIKETPIKEQAPPSVPGRVLQSVQPRQFRLAQCQRLRADRERRRCSEPDVRQDHCDHYIVPPDSVCPEASVLAGLGNRPVQRCGADTHVRRAPTHRGACREAKCLRHSAFQDFVTQ